MATKLQQDVTKLLGPGWKITNLMSDGSEFELVTPSNQSSRAIVFDVSSGACKTLQKYAKKYQTDDGMPLYAPPIGWGIIDVVKTTASGEEEEDIIWYDRSKNKLWSTETCAQGSTAVTPKQPKPPKRKTITTTDSSTNAWTAVIGLGLAVGILWMAVSKDKK
jgi:hypothetical protein